MTDFQFVKDNLDMYVAAVETGDITYVITDPERNDKKLAILVGYDYWRYLLNEAGINPGKELAADDQPECSIRRFEGPAIHDHPDVNPCPECGGGRT